MPTRHCKVYIHDLNVKAESQARRQLLMSGARFATKVRFVDDLKTADLWLLRKDSAFLNFANKRIGQNNAAVWCMDENQQLHDANKNNQPLQKTAIAAFIDGCILTQHQPLPKAKPANAKPVNASKFVKYLRYGFSQKRGKLFVQYQQALLLVDFSSMEVSYNEAGHKLLWQNGGEAIDLNRFEILGKRDSYPLFSQRCPAFAGVWQIMHNWQGASLIEPLNANSVLTLNTWPNFEQVSHDYEDYRLASVLQKRSLNVRQIAVLLKLSEQQIVSFFNTVFVTGFAQTTNASNVAKLPMPSAPRKSGISQLWKKMRSSFTTEKGAAQL